MKTIISRLPVTLKKGENTTVEMAIPILAENMELYFESGDSLLGTKIYVSIEDQAGTSKCWNEKFLLSDVNTLFKPMYRGDSMLTWQPVRIVIRTDEVESGFLAITVREVEPVNF